MFLVPRPDGDEVRRLADRVGLHLNEIEVDLIRQRLSEIAMGAEVFDELPVPQYAPNLSFPNRPRARRATPAEDPYNALISVCEIRGTEDGLLSGKSFGVKDHVAVAGVPMTCGSLFMTGYVPDYDATVVDRMLNAGATFTATHNMEPFGTSGAGIGGVSDYGRVINPQDPERMSGGSSSGSAAAVAGGLADISIATDAGGSLRIPAAWCGVVGIKPTHALVPKTGTAGIVGTLGVLGPMARTVEDAAKALQVMAGDDGLDPTQDGSSPTNGGYLDALDSSPTKLRVGVLEEGSPAEMDETIRKAFHAGLDLLRSRGAAVVPVSIPLHEAGVLAQLALQSGDMRHMFDSNLTFAPAKTWYPPTLVEAISERKRSRTRQLPLLLKFMMITGEFLDEQFAGRLYAKAHNVRQAFASTYDAALQDVDVLAMPTVPMLPPLYGAPEDYREALDRNLPGGERQAAFSSLMLNTAVFNLTGHPALTIPCPDGNATAGFQFIAPHHREDLLVQAGTALEQA